MPEDVNRCLEPLSDYASWATNVGPAIPKHQVVRSPHVVSVAESARVIASPAGEDPCITWVAFRARRWRAFRPTSTPLLQACRCCRVRITTVDSGSIVETRQGPCQLLAPELQYDNRWSVDRDHTRAFGQTTRAMATSSKLSREPIEPIDDDETASSAGEAQGTNTSVPKRKFEDVDVWAEEPDDQREKWLQSRKPKRARKSKAKGKGKNKDASKRATRTIFPGAFQGADASEGEDDPDQVLVPPHIAERRALFAENRRELGQAGLKIPPDYDGIYFSDDERDPRELEERPKLEHIQASRPYKDIALEASAGLIPASIAQYLRDYQVEGVKFLHERFVYQKGAILGDDSKESLHADFPIAVSCKVLQEIDISARHERHLLISSETALRSLLAPELS